MVEESAADTARRAVQDRGQFLARQDRWAELLTEIRMADEGRRTLPGAVPGADLLAYGARADVVNAVEHALGEGMAADGRRLIQGVMGLEAIRGSHRDDPYMAALLALAHADIGWAWRGPRGAPQVPALHRRRCAAHFSRAAALLDSCGGVAGSPFLAAARCALLPGQPGTDTEAEDCYAALIALCPSNHRPMRSLGLHLLPRGSGSYQALEAAARRTASQTGGVWGAGGYAWVYFDALAVDAGACAQVDSELFIEGLHDIAAACPGQETINLLAAYCTVALRSSPGASGTAVRVRKEIAEAASGLIRDRLREVHPMIWAHAADGFDNSIRVASARRYAARGQAGARDALTALFRDELAGGRSLTFTREGIQTGSA